MAEYICKLPVMFGGKKYFPGDCISGEVIIPKRAAALERSGHIVPVADEREEICEESPISPDTDDFTDNHINIPIRTENGFSPLTTTSQAVEYVFQILQMNVEDANPVISFTDDDDMLLILHAVEKRKGVLKAIEERHTVITAK